MFVSWSCWKSRFRVICRCLTPCFSVATWEDTAKHPVSFSSFKMRVYCVFCYLCCFQLAVTSTTRSSSQNCTSCQKTCRKIVNILIIRLKVHKQTNLSSKWTGELRTFGPYTGVLLLCCCSDDLKLCKMSYYRKFCAYNSRFRLFCPLGYCFLFSWKNMLIL